MNPRTPVNGFPITHDRGRGGLPGRLGVGHQRSTVLLGCTNLRLYGLEPFSVKASTDIWLERLTDEDRSRLVTVLRNGIDGPHSRHEIEYQLKWPNGEVHYLSCIFHVSFDNNGKASRLTGVQVDITERKRVEQRILHMATHDSLTGLANRLLLTDRLQQAILSNERNPHLIALLFIDLDHFKCRSMTPWATASAMNRSRWSARPAVQSGA